MSLSGFLERCEFVRGAFNPPNEFGRVPGENPQRGEIEEALVRLYSTEPGRMLIDYLSTQAWLNEKKIYFAFTPGHFVVDGGVRQDGFQDISVFLDLAVLRNTALFATNGTLVSSYDAAVALGHEFAHVAFGIADPWPFGTAPEGIAAEIASERVNGVVRQ